MDDRTLIAFIGVLPIAFIVGMALGSNISERHWQKILIEKYDATYCDGEFTLGKCK